MASCRVSVPSRVTRETFFSLMTQTLQPTSGFLELEKSIHVAYRFHYVRTYIYDLRCHCDSVDVMLFRSEDVLTLLALAETFQFEVIPLVQTFGHFEVLALMLELQ